MAQIHWFPGHMKKALNEIEGKIKMMDIIIEILDARAPFSSINPLLTPLIANKKVLYVMAKNDLADPIITKSWKDDFIKKGQNIIDVDLTKEDSLKEINKWVIKLGEEKRNKDKAKGMKPQPSKVMVLGIPNVGKSSLINRLAKRKAAGVQNKPGYTRGEQWIKVNNDFLLLDTPGVLPMNYENRKTAVNLALVGSIREDILPEDDLFTELVNYLHKEYPLALEKRFNITDLSDEHNVLSLICERRKIVGDSADSRAKSLLLKEFKDGLLGRISLEKCH